MELHVMLLAVVLAGFSNAHLKDGLLFHSALAFGASTTVSTVLGAIALCTAAAFRTDRAPVTARGINRAQIHAIV